MARFENSGLVGLVSLLLRLQIESFETDLQSWRGSTNSMKSSPPRFCAGHLLGIGMHPKENDHSATFLVVGSFRRTREAKQCLYPYWFSSLRNYYGDVCVIGAGLKRCSETTMALANGLTDGLMKPVTSGRCNENHVLHKIQNEKETYCLYAELLGLTITRHLPVRLDSSVHARLNDEVCALASV